MRVEAIERRLPATKVPVALGGRPEASLTEDHFRLLPAFDEPNGAQHLVRGIAVPDEAVHQALRRNDLEEDAMLPEGLSAIGTAEEPTPFATGTRVDLDQGGGMTFRAPPVRQHLGVSPSVEDDVARGVEHARDFEGVAHFFFLRNNASSRSNRRSQKRRYGSSQSATPRSGPASRRQGRHWASRPRAISPACSSTLRCFEIAGILIANGSASSVTDASPSARRDRIARRVGSASAENVALSASVAVGI